MSPGREEQNQINERELDFRVFMAETVIYRKEQIKKLDSLMEDMKKFGEKLSLLPCRERSKIYEGISGQIKLIWCILLSCIAAIVGVFFKH